MIKIEKEFKNYGLKIELSKYGFMIDYYFIKNLRKGFWFHICKRLISIKLNNILIELWLINFRFNLNYKIIRRSDYSLLSLNNFVIYKFK